MCHVLLQLEASERVRQQLEASEAASQATASEVTAQLAEASTLTAAVKGMALTERTRGAELEKARAAAVQVRTPGCLALPGCACSCWR